MGEDEYMKEVEVLRSQLRAVKDAVTEVTE